MPAHKNISDYNLKETRLPSIKSKYLLCSIIKENVFSIPVVKYDENFINDISLELNEKNKLGIAISDDFINEIIDILYKARNIKIANLND